MNKRKIKGIFIIFVASILLITIITHLYNEEKTLDILVSKGEDKVKDLEMARLFIDYHIYRINQPEYDLVFGTEELASRELAEMLEEIKLMISKDTKLSNDDVAELFHLYQSNLLSKTNYKSEIIKDNPELCM